MSLLKYTSDEMYSSTELIRRSKMIFDKISDKAISKAVILRDGKPSFIMLDFFEYERLSKEYLSMKENQTKSNKPSEVNLKSKEIIKENKQSEELKEDDLQKALDEIDNLNLRDIKKDKNIENKEVLKDFWE